MQNLRCLSYSSTYLEFMPKRWHIGNPYDRIIVPMPETDPELLLSGYANGIRSGTDFLQNASLIFQKVRKGHQRHGEDISGSVWERD